MIIKDILFQIIRKAPKKNKRNKRNKAMRGQKNIQEFYIQLIKKRQNIKIKEINKNE